MSINPLANRPRADACGFGNGLRRLSARDLTYNALSTARRQPGILMHVHPVLPWNLKLQQPQPPRSEPDGQPTESSQLVLAAQQIRVTLSELHPVGALEAEHRPRLGRRRDLIAEVLDDAPDLGYLLGVARSELAGRDVERVLEADTHVAAEHARGGAEVELVAAAGEHRPEIIVAEQAVGGALHEDEVVHVGADAAEDAVDELQEYRWPEQTFVDAMGEIVEMPGVVALVLEFHAMAFAERLGDALDVAERIAEDVLVGVEKVALLPVVFPFLVASRHRVECEIHRPHVERAHFRREFFGGRDPILHRHQHASASGDVDDGIAALLDARQELAKDFRIGRRPAVLRVARVQMQDRSAGFGGIDRLGGDLIGCDRKRVRHGRRVDRAGDGAGDDDLVGELGHRRLLVFALYLVSGRPLGALGGRVTIRKYDATFKGEDFPTEALDQKPPDAFRGEEHDGDRDSAEHHQVDGTEVGERLAQQEEHQRADDRALDAADAADHGDEDHEGGPVVDAEGGVRRDAQLLQENQRAEHGGAKDGDDVDDELDPDNVDPVALRGELIVADRPERKAVARAQQEHDRGEDSDRERECNPVDDELAHLA